MRDILNLAWQRFNIIVGVLGDVQGRLFATLFYFTIFVPFGIGSKLFTDPLRLRSTNQTWLARPPIPSDLESAKRQG